MIGNVKINEQPFRLSKSNGINAAIHVLLLLITVPLLSAVLSLTVRNLGGSDIFQSTLGLTPPYQLQAQLFELSEDFDTEEKVLLVGQRQFFEKLLAGSNLSQCESNFKILDIPDYSIRHLKYQSSKKGLYLYKNLKFKKLIFENHISLWTELSTQPSVSKLDLWNQAKKDGQVIMNRKDLRLLFDYTIQIFHAWWSTGLIKSVKTFDVSRPLYSFQHAKYVQFREAIEADISFYLNKHQPEYMKNGEFEKFERYFTEIKNTGAAEVTDDPQNLIKLLGC